MPSNSLELALSPCPNDTFLFHAWIHGLVGTLKINPTFADIETLNCFALEKKYPLIKISMGCFSQVQNDYELLPVGCALGWDVGPKLIATRPLALDDIPHATILIPGEHTTAHRLLNLLLPPFKEKIFCAYHEIFPLLKQNKAHCGLIIHESRFTFAEHGFYEICDLGELWHARFDLPLPLGGLALRKSHAHLKTAVISHLQTSLLYARTYPNDSKAFIQHHAQEKNPAVIQKHIDLYVNDETLHLSEKSQQAIHQLCHS